jgi:hypothetical protein
MIVKSEGVRLRLTEAMEKLWHVLTDLRLQMEMESIAIAPYEESTVIYYVIL